MRARFIYQLFDADMSDEVDRLEFRNTITSFIEMILSCKFESEVLQEKIKTLNMDSISNNLMEKVLDLYVENVYGTFSFNREMLTYEEWEKWLYSIEGIDKIMDFTGILKYN
jgi:hypothetical protein